VQLEKSAGRFSDRPNLREHGRNRASRALQRTRGAHHLSLAFLAPAIVRAAVESRLPYGLTASNFSELPILWEEQLQIAS
jgi:hypothetical protein